MSYHTHTVYDCLAVFKRLNASYHKTVVTSKLAYDVIFMTGNAETPGSNHGWNAGHLG